MGSQFNSTIESLLQGPYCVIDFLPERVEADSDGQFFAVEEFYRRPEQLRDLRKRFANVLLKLNCYEDLQVCFCDGEGWEKNPEPERLMERVLQLPQNGFMRVIIKERETMIDMEGCDTYMTLYGTSETVLRRVELLAQAEGLFLRKGEQ